jgi:hypothetical protein
LTFQNTLKTQKWFTTDLKTSLFLYIHCKWILEEISAKVLDLKLLNIDQVDLQMILGGIRQEKNPLKTPKYASHVSLTDFCS